MTADRVSIAYDTTTVFVTGVNDIPGTLPDVIGMGASDAVYLLEKSGYRVKTNGFGRVFRQSPTSGMPGSKGELVSLELGFDELEIMRKDSMIKADSINGAVLLSMPVEPPKTEVKPVPAPVVPKVEKSTTPASKPSTKKQVKPKPSQAAIDKWKAKVAAQKAADKKKNAAKNSKTTKTQQ